MAGYMCKSMFPSKPSFTDANVPSLAGKVYIVTGSNSGIGKVLASILYGKNAKVYVGARSRDKALEAIDDMKKEHPNSKGELVFLKLDLSDLSTVRGSAEEFLSKENRLDVLWNNAGVMVPPAGSTTAQGYELQLGTNNLAPFLFTTLLEPALLAAARNGEARVVWTSSSAGVVGIPKPPIDFTNMDYKKDENIWTKYGRSKVGNILHAVEFARRNDRANTGIIHVALDPGFLKTGLQRSTPSSQAFMLSFITKEPRFGAYVLLFAGLHPSITREHNGAFVSPPGRLDHPPKVLMDEELGQKYWEWTEKQVQPYM